MSNAVYRKAVENLKNLKVVSNKKDYLKWASKSSYMLHKIFHHDLVAISKNKVTLTLNKPTYIGICISKLRKVLLYEFHYNYNKNKHGNNSRPLFIDPDSLMYEDVYDDFSNVNKCLTSVIIQLSKNILITQTNQWLVKRKMKKLVLRLNNLLD